MPFNSGYRGRRANDGQGMIGQETQFLQKISPRPYISGYSVQGIDDTALDPAGGQTVIINGSGFATGVSAIVGGVQIASVTLISSKQISFTSPAKTAGSYTLVVYNSSSDAASILVPGLIYSGVPQWTTSAGSIGSVYETNSINTSVVATSDSAITYTLSSGSLPTGSTLYANGVITGTAPVDSGSTTYTFAVTATDAELQDTTRTFTLTVNTDVVTWVNPASGATITVDGSYSTTLSASDAAGYNVSYTANSLPTGLTLSGNTISGTATVEATTTTLLTATAATTGRTSTNTITWTVSLGDLYFNYVTTLLSARTPSPPPFNDDASTNNFAVTINGDSRPYNSNPYTPGYYSVNFNGSTMYLSTVNQGFATSDFTIEAWVNCNTVSTVAQTIFDCRLTNSSSTGFWFGLYYNGTVISPGVYTNGAFAVNTAVNCLNTWVHTALVRSGSSFVIYVNGVNSGTFTSSASFTDTNALIGASPTVTSSSTNYLLGNISNLRIVKGTAVYTSNFTPSTTPLTAIANTSLLTCQSNRFIDNSSNNSTITPNNSPLIKSFNPYTPNSSYSAYGSTYFDGTGDFLSTPTGPAAFDFTSTKTLTLEFWVNSPSWPAGNSCFFDLQEAQPFRVLYTPGTIAWQTTTLGTNIITAGVTLLPNVWYHLAFVRNTNTLYIFVNGVQVATASYSSNWVATATGNVRVGCNRGDTWFVNGYMTDVRLVKGTALYTANFTPPTQPLTAISGTSLLTSQSNQPVSNNTFLDKSTNDFAITRNGNTTQGTFSPYGTNWSNYFDGGTNRLTTGTSSIFNLTGANITLECWVYMTVAPSVNNRLITIGPNNAQSSLQFSITTGRVFDVGVAFGSGGGVNSGANTIPLNTWTHLAFVLSGTTGTIYINGSQVGQSTGWSITSSTTNYFYLGYDSTATIDGKFTGYVSNARLVIGTAIYTSAFTPSSAPLQPVSNTKMLLAQSNNITDTSPFNTTLTTTGAVPVQKFGPFASTTLPTPYYSVYFDGTGDYLSVPTNASLNITSGSTDSFVCEFWVNWTTVGANMSVIDNGGLSGTSFPNWEIRLNASNQITLGWGNSAAPGSTIGTLATTTVPTAGRWYYITFVKTNSDWSLFIDGTRATTFNGLNTAAKTSATALYIGYGIATSAGGTGFAGCISNIRIYNGATASAPYSATSTTITVPTSPPTAITNTQLLTCQNNTFVDNSTNNFTITATGNAVPKQISPFTMSYSTKQSYTPSVYGGSMYFDGTGDYLNFTGSTGTTLSANFTIEAWVYLSTIASLQPILCIGDSFSNPGVMFYIATDGKLAIAYANARTYTGSTALLINSWNHVAFVRSGSTITGYLNGVSQGTLSNSSTFSGTTSYVGRELYNGGTGGQLSGYLSDVRLNNGTALYTSNFVPQNAPLQAVKNTTLLVNGTGAGILDASEITEYESIGDAKISTSVVPFSGSTSMYFDGSGDYLATVNPGSNFKFGTGNWTIEAWIYSTSSSTTQTIYLVYGTTIDIINIQYNGSTLAPFVQIRATNQASTTITSTVTASLNAWNHIAVVRDSATTIKLYVNGSLGATATVASTTTFVDTQFSQNPTVGAKTNTVTNYFVGYISDLRVTKGIARYTTTFTPPTSPFPISQK